MLNKYIFMSWNQNLYVNLTGNINMELTWRPAKIVADEKYGTNLELLNELRRSNYENSS